VLAVYQVLPGPEATEMACYFGMIAKGRLGSFLGGLGFVIPGLILMLLFSWVYKTYGLTNQYVKASFEGLQPAVAAMVFKAVHKIGEGVIVDSKTKEFSILMLCIALAAGAQGVMGINFFIILLWCGLEALFLIEFPKGNNRIKGTLGYVFAVLMVFILIVSYVIFVYYLGKPESSVLGSNVITSNQLYDLFLLGLLAGLLTFGGAYTAIPFVQQSAVINGGWLPNDVFLDGIAIAAVLPAPLVIFNTFVGYYGGELPGALLMTLGVFLPAFSFTLIGHEFFEKATKVKFIMTFLDGVTAGAVGLIGTSAFVILQNTATNIPSALIFTISLGATYIFLHRYTNMVVVVIAAIAGQIFFAPGTPTPSPPANITFSY
jgi:chromate transporter